MGPQKSSQDYSDGSNIITQTLLSKELSPARIRMKIPQKRKTEELIHVAETKSERFKA
jgi:hypothetical protein